MTKILFVCHGNICRSSMAELMLRSMTERIGLGEEFEIDSAATSSEELGNPVYPPARRKLDEHGISSDGKYARRITQQDYDYFDHLICMDEENRYYLNRLFNNDPDHKVSLLLQYAGRNTEEVSDPWYTGDFDATWNDLWEGLLGLLNTLNGDLPVILDFSKCTSRKNIYHILRRKMLWQDWYGSNLDALSDILTGELFFGKNFRFVLPEDATLTEYAEKVISVFSESGLSCEIIP